MTDEQIKEMAEKVSPYSHSILMHRCWIKAYMHGYKAAMQGREEGYDVYVDKSFMGFGAKFRVGVQTFCIGPQDWTEEEAEWMVEMFRKALSKLGQDTPKESGECEQSHCVGCDDCGRDEG